MGVEREGEREGGGRREKVRIKGGREGEGESERKERQR